MKRLAPLVITAVFLALVVGTVLPLAHTAVAQQAENRVGAQFSTGWIHDSPEDTFTKSYKESEQATTSRLQSREMSGFGSDS